MEIKSVLVLLTFATFVFAEERSRQTLRVVSSFSILGDLVQQVGGDAIEQTILVGAEQDAHIYEPKPQDNIALHRADLVFFNGLHFEGWMPRLVQASGYRGEVVLMEAGLPKKREILAGDGKEIFDPHAWHDVENAMHYVRRIRDALMHKDPERTDDYRKRAALYTDTLTALHTEIKTAFATLPPDSRRVITTHDAFGYFGEAYSLKFVAPLGWSTDEQPSAAKVAQLIDQIKGIQALGVFLENGLDGRLAKQIASATGLKLGGYLLADALSRQGTLGSTYVGMMRHNVKTLKAF